MPKWGMTYRSISSRTRQTEKKEKMVAPHSCRVHVRLPAGVRLFYLSHMGRGK